MAPKKSDRLAPPLMFAFRAAHEERDGKLHMNLRENGDRVIAKRRVTTRSPISERGLRKEVTGDLLSLLNTTNLDAIEDLSSLPEVRRSILNFGFPDLSWRSIEDNSIAEIANEIQTALVAYEPRLIGESVRAARDFTVDSEDLRLRFLVKAELRAQPMSVPVEFIAEVELDSGKIKIDRL
jgi:type VI secretion system protein ImpF